MTSEVKYAPAASGRPLEVCLSVVRPALRCLRKEVIHAVMS